MIDLSPLNLPLKDKTAVVLGLGRSGLTAARALKNARINVVVWDDDAAARARALEEGLTVADPLKSDFNFKSVAFIVMSPGIPLTHPKPHPLVDKAKAAGKEILSDVELFIRAKPLARTIGITGTNGKSTTTALIGHVLKVAGKKVEVGGNIGTGALDLDDISGNDAVYVLELSSYQLDLCPYFAPTVAVLLNISPDHLDRHGTMENYIAAKARIMRGSGTAIIALDDEPSRDIAAKVQTDRRRQLVTVSTQKQAGVFVTSDGILTDTTEGSARKILDLKTCKTLRGEHNWQNAAAAYAAVRALGVDAKTIAEAFAIFPGLAHRQNLVATIGGVSYINDSKATNDPAAAMALKTYDNIYWIAGGKPKGDTYPDCEKHLGRVRHAFLIGAAQDKMAEWLTAKNIPFTRCETMKKALSAAHRQAQADRLEGATVLLSPACASFDQFKNFEERGDTFVKYVHQLADAGDRFSRPSTGGRTP